MAWIRYGRLSIQYLTKSEWWRRVGFANLTRCDLLIAGVEFIPLATNPLAPKTRIWESKGKRYRIEYEPNDYYGKAFRFRDFEQCDYHFSLCGGREHSAETLADLIAWIESGALPEDIQQEYCLCGASIIRLTPEQKKACMDEVQRLQDAAGCTSFLEKLRGWRPKHE